MAPSLEEGIVAINASARNTLSESQGTDHVMDFSDDSETYTVALDKQKVQPLAIVGLSLRFPEDAVTEESFWQMLAAGRCVMSDYPKDRINIDAFYHPDTSRTDTIPCRGGHFLKQPLGAFDAPFFSITPAEAPDMDPMQRGLLEATYRALENAGLPMESVAKSKTSVYTGCFTNDYQAFMPKNPQDLPRYSATGSSPAMLANRLSWFFDFTGNSVNVDSACSSSLTALHLACQDLWSGESKMSIAAGCNLMFSLEAIAVLSNMNFLSPDSRCYSFDHRANGYSRGEGFGVVIVKTLGDALKNGDTIRCVIRSTGTNQDGFTPGITQPNGEAQERLIQETYLKAGLSMKSTGFFESHGTGTPLGDPLEATAIGTAFKKERSLCHPLIIGAVKSNIGHLGGASGMAGLIKTIMILERGLIPPNANFESLNPKIDPKELNLEFPVELRPWPHNGLRRASVNSFGFGGTNCHVVLDDAYNYLRIHKLDGQHATVQKVPSISLRQIMAPDTASPVQSHGHLPMLTSTIPKLLLWSTADKLGMARMAKKYVEYFTRINKAMSNAEFEHFLDSLSYTLTERRTSLSWKSFAIIKSLPDLMDLPSRISEPVNTSRLTNRRLGFIFTGQGAQWARMGQDLIVYPIFKHSLQESALVFQSVGASWSLFEELEKTKAESKVNGPGLSQSLCTALQIALVDLLSSFGVKPLIAIGHSSGEIAAAYCTGAISRQSALKIAYFRGLLASSLVPCFQGIMMSVGLDRYQILPFLDEIKAEYDNFDLSVACYNSPANITVSGNVSQVVRLKALLDERNIFARKLQVQVAYHSSHMYEIADRYLDLIGELEAGDTSDLQSSIMVSSVFGRKMEKQELLESKYWVENLTSPVKFLEALNFALHISAEDGSSDPFVNDLIEIGPHSALRGPIKDILQHFKMSDRVKYYSMLTRYGSGLNTALKTVGELKCDGYDINLATVNYQRGKISSRQKVLTDLPEYPFDHSKIYWTENRLSRCFRFRKHARLDLLGTPSPDSTPFEKKWRHTLKIQEMPWIDDHKINNTILYPAAGMLAMAIEAMKQTAGSGPDTNAKFSGFRMKDVFFQSPLIVPTNQSGVDTQFTLLAAPRILDKSLNWSEFRLYAFSNNEWTLVCRGHIRPTNGERNSDFNNGRELRERNKVYENIYQTQDESCTSRVDSDVIYQHLASCGLQYGPAFRRLNHISYNAKGDAIGELDLFRWTAENSSNHVQEHVIHPTSLDGLFQLSLIGTSRGEDQKTPTMVPTRINSMWISNERLSYPSSNSITVCAKSVPSTISQSGASIFGLDRDNKAPLIIIHGLQATIVANDENVQSIPNKLPRLCYSIDWKPDMSLMSSQEKLSYCEIGNADTPEPVEFSQAVHFMVLAYITKTLKVVDRAILATAEPHYQKYVRWMEFQAERFHAGALHDILPNSPSLLEDIKYQDALSTSLAEGNVQGKTYVEIGQNLVDILHGSVDPLALLFQTNLAAEYYAEISNSARFLKPMQRYMQALAHKDPSMRILEIGAGTGGVTTHMLNSLMPPTSDASAETSTPMYDSYDFTDISRSFFPEAQRKFVHHGSRLNYSILNIDEDPELQGFENNTYDMVIAASALHVTKDLNLTIRRIRKLLKIGGKLVLVEPTKPDQLGCNFIFGLLPGWWPDGTDGRETGPLVTEAGWNDICTRNGFSQVDITFTDYQNESCQESSIMIFTAVDTNEHTTTTEMPNNDAPIIMIRETSNLQLEMSHMLQAHFLENGYLGCEIVTLSEASKIDALGGKSCISLLEVDASAIWNFTLSEYKAFQLLIRSKVKLLWVKGAVGSNGGPNRGVVDGLSRVLRAEDTALVFVTLELEISEANKTHNLPRCVKHICQVLSTTSEHAASHSFEPEYKEIDGLLQIKRIVEERPLDRHISIQTCRTELRVFQLDQGPPLRISVGTPGLLESLQLIHDKSAGEPLQKQHIEVQTHAIGLNFMDLLTALGRLGDGTQIGTECAGIVSRVGDDAKGYFKIGDRVLVAYSDTCRTYVRCHYQCAVILPSNIPFTLAAGLPTTFGTAYHSLHKVARLQKGETLLIHSAAGGTGQSAIQIGLEIGAEIFATVGSQIKKEFLMETYGLSEDHIFSSRDTVFAESVLRMTKGEGVDVVLNSLSGEGLIASWECIAPYGRFIEIGKKDIQSAERLPMLPFARNVSFSAVDMAAMTKDRPHYMQSLLTILIQKMEQGQIRTSQPLQVYKLSEMEQAFRHLQSGQSRGKLVLEVDREKEIEAILDVQPSFKFYPDASYVIAGGLGGIGRSICKWMASRGAKNMIVLSRRGSKNKYSKSLQEELKDQGVHLVTPACDIVNLRSLKTCLKTCSQHMPPIKGCIQAAVVMRDATFTKVSYEDWKDCLEPKVLGSWNLHQSLPQGMDFFLCLSSISGIVGRETQGCYAAGNTYLDSLAQFRILHGEKAVSIDLGIMEEDGMLAEDPSLMNRAKSSGALIPIYTAQLHALLDYYCNPTLPMLDCRSCQPLIGLEVPANLFAKNIDLPPFLYLPTFKHLFQIAGDYTQNTNNGNNAKTDISAQIASAASVAEAAVIVTQALMDRLSTSVGIPIDELRDDKPMHQHGVDSLLAIELRNWFAKKIGADVAIFDILGDLGIKDVAGLAARKSVYKQTSWADN